MKILAFLISAGICFTLKAQTTANIEKYLDSLFQRSIHEIQKIEKLKSEISSFKFTFKGKKTKVHLKSVDDTSRFVLNEKFRRRGANEIVKSNYKLANGVKVFVFKINGTVKELRLKYKNRNYGFSVRMSSVLYKEAEMKIFMLYKKDEQRVGKTKIVDKLIL